MRHRFFLQQKWNIYIDWGNHMVMARHDMFTFYLENQMKKTKFRKWKRKTNAVWMMIWRTCEKLSFYFGVVVFLCVYVCLKQRALLFVESETACDTIYLILVVFFFLFYYSDFGIFFYLVLFFEFFFWFLLSTYLVTIIFFTWIVETNMSSIVCVPI